MTNGLERRKLQRLSHSLEVAVEIATGEEVPRVLPPVHLKSRNISKDGICLETKVLEIHGINLLAGSPYARENRLHLKIKLFPEEPPFHAIGEVRWYDSVRDPAEFTYYLGVEFLEIKGSHKKQLTKFLKTHETKKAGLRKLFS